jgi:hypothetical protein
MPVLLQCLLQFEDSKDLVPGASPSPAGIYRSKDKTTTFFCIRANSSCFTSTGSKNQMGYCHHFVSLFIIIIVQ